MSRRYVFIGDIHSQHQKLEKCLHFLERKFGEDFFPIFLGDIFDPRLEDPALNVPPYSDSQRVADLVFNIVEKEKGILLQSNHQNKLLRWLNHDFENIKSGKKNPIETSFGLSHTLEHYVQKMNVEEKTKLRDRLAHLPYGILVTDFSHRLGRECVYGISHAFFSMSALGPPASISKRVREDAIYGIFGKGARYPWWLHQEQKFPDRVNGQRIVRVAGHYHILDIHDYYIMLDADCGTTGGDLAMYIPSTGDLVLSNEILV